MNERPVLFPLVWHGLLARMGSVFARWLPDKVFLGEYNKASVIAFNKVLWDPSGKGAGGILLLTGFNFQTKWNHFLQCNYCFEH